MPKKVSGDDPTPADLIRNAEVRILPPQAESLGEFAYDAEVRILPPQPASPSLTPTKADRARNAEEQPIAVRELDPTAHLALKYNQLTSQRGILSLKLADWSERRNQQPQKEEEQRDHRGRRYVIPSPDQTMRFSAYTPITASSIPQSLTPCLPDTWP